MGVSQQQSSPTNPLTKPESSRLPTATKNQDPTVEGVNWKNVTIPLYRLSVSIPPAWTIQEINRRAEPTGNGHPVKGHDCAEYKIVSDDKYVVLELIPTCGFYEGVPSSWGENTAVIKELGPKEYIVRMFDPKNGYYKYATGSELTILNQQGPRVVKTVIDTLSFKKDEDLTFVILNLHYFGSVSRKDHYLQIADRIVTSIEQLQSSSLKSMYME